MTQVYEHPLTDYCKLKFERFTINWSYMALCYIERQGDPWFSDSETEVDLEKEDCVKLIQFLMQHMKIEKEEL